MKYNHFCVVDMDGVYKTFVLVKLEQGLDGKIIENVQNYKLSDGEKIVDAKKPVMRVCAESVGFVKPCWDEDAETWVEGATAEEMAAWEAEHPAPEVPEPPPSLEARVDELAEALDMILSGVTE